jgi:nicotinate-nucleotide adenylyltransferase
MLYTLSLMNNEKTSRIGIFGGSFDPPHEAHLAMARIASERFELERVVFVPCNQNPLRDITGHASPFHRYVLTQLATLVEDKFLVTPLELNRGGMSYTIDTLNAFHRTECKLFLIMGADSFQTIDRWKSVEKYSSLCELIVFSRDAEKPENVIDENILGISHFVSGFDMDISSTEIRKKVRLGESLDNSISPMVKVYIEKYELYQHFRDQNRLINDPIGDFFVKGS